MPRYTRVAHLQERTRFEGCSRMSIFGRNKTHRWSDISVRTTSKVTLVYTPIIQRSLRHGHYYYEQMINIHTKFYKVHRSVNDLEDTKLLYIIDTTIFLNLFNSHRTKMIDYLINFFRYLAIHRIKINFIIFFCNALCVLNLKTKEYENLPLIRQTG